MLEIVKTLIASLSLAATGAGMAWALTAGTGGAYDSLALSRTSNQPAKSDRLDAASVKADRLANVSQSHGIVVIVYPQGQAESMIFRAPVALASAR